MRRTSRKPHQQLQRMRVQAGAKRFTSRLQYVVWARFWCTVPAVIWHSRPQHTPLPALCSLCPLPSSFAETILDVFDGDRRNCGMAHRGLGSFETRCRLCVCRSFGRSISASAAHFGFNMMIDEGRVGWYGGHSARMLSGVFEASATTAPHTGDSQHSQ
jgi:hypothetical protein